MSAGGRNIRTALAQKAYGNEPRHTTRRNNGTADMTQTAEKHAAGHVCNKRKQQGDPIEPPDNYFSR